MTKITTPELIPDLQAAIRLTEQAGASGGASYFYSRIVEDPYSARRGAGGG